MLYTKIQPQNVLGWKKSLSVLPYMAMEAVLFNGPGPFKQIVNTFLTEDPTWILVKIAEAVSENTFKTYTVLYMYIAQGQRQITPREKILLL